MADTRKAAESTTANAFETTLSSQLGASDLTINVASTTGLASPCYIVVEPDSATQREYIFIDSTVGATSFTTTTGDNRYLSGSAAGSGLVHPSGSKVRVAPMKQHFEDIFDALGKVVDTTYSSATAGEVVLDVTSATVAVASDEIPIIDADDSNKVKKESVADLVSGIASTGLSASAGQLSVSGLTTSEIAAGSLTDSTDTIAANDSDTQIPTSAAVLDLADTKLNLSGGTLTGAVDAGDQELTKFIAKDYKEDIATTSDSGTSFTSNTLTLDVQDGNVFDITLDANITTWTINNMGAGTTITVILRQSTGGHTAPTQINSTTFKTPGAAGLTLTTGASAIDVVSVFYDGTDYLVFSQLAFG